MNRHSIITVGSANMAVAPTYYTNIIISVKGQEEFEIMAN